jgi:transcriptional regulator with XRE-family HTH domain
MRVRSIADAASAVRGRRTDLNLSQSALAKVTGISRKWISEFEHGKTTAEFALVLRVLEGLDLKLELEIDEGSAAATTYRRTPAAPRLGHTPLSTLAHCLRNTAENERFP